VKNDVTCCRGGGNDLDNHDNSSCLLLQANFGFKIRIYGVATQGRNGGNRQWVTFYMLQYSEEATGDNWMDYKENGVVRVSAGNGVDSAELCVFGEGDGFQLVSG
jgi:hypothetical protein